MTAVGTASAAATRPTRFSTLRRSIASSCCSSGSIGGGACLVVRLIATPRDPPSFRMHECNRPVPLRRERNTCCDRCPVISLSYDERPHLPPPRAARGARARHRRADPARGARARRLGGGGARRSGRQPHRRSRGGQGARSQGARSSSRPKTGTQVRERRYWHMLDPDVLAWRVEAEPRDDFYMTVFETRRLIEPAVAALAATRASRSRDRRARGGVRAHGGVRRP